MVAAEFKAERTESGKFGLISPSIAASPITNSLSFLTQLRPDYMANFSPASETNSQNQTVHYMERDSARANGLKNQK